MTKPLVIVESPYAGGLEANVEYARACVRDCLLRGEAPFASHLLFTQVGVLKDEIAEQRKLGMEAGWAFYRVASKCVVYVDRGISGGMVEGMRKAVEAGVDIEVRRLSDFENR